MTLSKVFIRAACTGLMAFSAGTGFAAFPQLPLAEDLLVEQGVARERAATLVKSLAGTASVRVLSRTGLENVIDGLGEEIAKAEKNGDQETASRYNQMGLIARKIQKERDKEGAFLLPARRDGVNFLQQLNPGHAAIAQAECYLRPDEASDIRPAISSFTTLPAAFIEKDLVSKRDFSLAVILHELAHCHSDDVAAGQERESRADLQALAVMKTLSADPDFTRHYMLLRIMTPNFTTHNTALFIDAESRHEPPVRYEQIEALYQDLMQRHNRKRAQLDMSVAEGKPFLLSLARVFKAVLLDRPADLNPLTRRYMELFIESAKAIAPTTAATLLNDMQPGGNKVAENADSAAAIVQNRPGPAVN